MDNFPIFTEINNCRDCYKCVRTCPVKAIKIHNSHAVITPERCIYCGTCVNVCPNGVKKIRNDVDRIRMAFLSKRTVVASIAPSFASEYEDNTDNLIRCLYKLGFDIVSETALGAALVSQALDMYVRANGFAPYISTACPSVVELVKKHYPDMVSSLAPLPSPIQTHSAYLKELYGDDIVVVFIGPCVAKKLESDQTPGYPDIAITFSELATWMEEENIRIENVDQKIEPKLMPCHVGKAGVYPLEFGQIESSEQWMNSFLSSDAVSASGINQIKSSLKGAMPDTFLEALNCGGGCINGPGTLRKGSTVVRKKAVAKYVMQQLRKRDYFQGDNDFALRLMKEGYGVVKSKQPVSEAVEKYEFSENQIQDALLKLGKISKDDELNCGGCGYDTCRSMAKALLAGMSEPEMCVTKMRKDAENKMDILLSTIPHGVVIVDNDLNIMECNKAFVQIFEDYPDEFLDAEGLKAFRATPLSALCPFADKFGAQFNKAELSHYRFKHNGNVMRVTFFMVERKRLLGALFEDITQPTVKREAVVSKAQDAISKTLQTVQQIASLLGESAADTEIVLNSIIDEFNVNTDSSADYGLIKETAGNK